MRYEDLVCARCARPVVEASCPACRRSKAEMDGSRFTLTPQMLAIVCAVIALLTLVATRHLA